jgi:hypothetical protein
VYLRSFKYPADYDFNDVFNRNFGLMKDDSFEVTVEFDILRVKFQQIDHIAPEANTKSISMSALIPLAQFSQRCWHVCFIGNVFAYFSQPPFIHLPEGMMEADIPDIQIRTELIAVKVSVE